jgi:Brp/Blh family beta-carotene 15,15'-monooxygenase
VTTATVPVVMRRATWLSVIALAVTSALFIAVPGLRSAHDIPAVALIGFAFGVPHGAVDHLLPQSDRWPLRGRNLMRLFGGYVAVAAVVLAVALTSPVVAVGLIIVFSVVHLGTADAATRQERQGRPPRYGIADTLAYGGPLGFVPLVRWPDQVASIFRMVAPGLEQDLRTPALFATILCAGAGIVVAVRAANRREWTVVAELSVLWVLVLTVPPLAAFGVYFAAWHALRQYARLFADSSATQEVDGRPLNRRSLILTMAGGTAATLILAGVAVVALRYNSEALTRLRLGDWCVVLLAAVVAPHMITILRYDRWKTARATALRPGWGA